MNWQPEKCKPGDIIRVHLGILHHYGVFVSEERVIQFGLPPIPENRMPQDEVAVLATDIDTFACGRIVEVASFDKGERAKKFSPDEIIARATARIGEKGYNLIHNNCEHFVNECALGVKYCSVEDDARRRWNNRPVLDVYLARIDTDEPIAPVFPPLRYEEISACANAKLKASKYADWRLLSSAVENSFRLDFNSIAFTKTKRGKWLADKLFFSLSHSGDFVAVAVSNLPVGVDIEFEPAFSSRWETGDEKLSALAKKVYTKSELREADTVTPQDFIKKWTVKEAVFKRNGKGKYRPRRISSSDKNSAAFKLCNEGLPTVAVSGEHLRRVRFYLFENGKAAPVKGSEL